MCFVCVFFVSLVSACVRSCSCFLTTAHTHALGRVSRLDVTRMHCAGARSGLVVFEPAQVSKISVAFFSLGCNCLSQKTFKT